MLKRVGVFLAILFLIVITSGNGLFAVTMPNINQAVTADINFTATGIDFTSNGTTTSYDPGSINITGTNAADPGYVNGSITAYQNDYGVVNISTNYNTVRDAYGQTNFGTSTNYLNQVNVTNNSLLTVSNAFYVNNINLNNSNLALNTNTQKIQNITKTAGTTATVDINTNFLANGAQFGTSGSKINKININSGNIVQLLNSDMYVDNLYLGASTTLLISGTSTIYGNVLSQGSSGNGTLNILTNYTTSAGTVFGSASSRIGAMLIQSGYSVDLNNTAYINDVILFGGNLYLNSGGGLMGTISRSGTVYINENYTATDGAANIGSSIYNTTFGTSTFSLTNLTILGSNALTLDNQAYIDTINFGSTGSTLVIGASGGINNGIIQGASNNYGNLHLNRNYDTSNTTSSDYFNTTFGTSTNSINWISVGTSSTAQTLTLGNLVYSSKTVLPNTSSTLNLEANSGVTGEIYGTSIIDHTRAAPASGIININRDYATTDGVADIANGLFNTNFGSLNFVGSPTVVNEIHDIDTINLGQNVVNTTAETIVTLDLGNLAVVRNLNISDNSTLNIGADGIVTGTIMGMEDSQGNVNIDRDYATNYYDATLSIGANFLDTTFGTATNRLKTTTITNHSFTLTNTAYINNFNMISNISYTDTRRLLTMEGNSQFNGSMSLQARSNDRLIAVVLDEAYMNELSNLLTLIDTGNSGTSTISSNNQVFLNLIDINTMTEGKSILISSGKDYTNAGLTYDGIFLDLKLQPTTANELYLVVKQNRTPTTNDVSQATVTASTQIDSWKYYQKSLNENTLTANLQAITDKQEFFHAITNLAPNVSGLATKAPTQSIISAVANIDKRLNFLRVVKISEKNDLFMSNLLKHVPTYYDEYLKKHNLWWEFFGGIIKQDTVENIYGYDANFYGATIGYDFELNPSSVFGMSYTFNYIDANDLDTVKNDRDTIDAMTHNLDLYAMFYNKWNYLALNIGGGFNIYDQERNINFYNFHKKAKADYNGYSYHAGVEYGFNILLYNSVDSSELNIRMRKAKGQNRYEEMSKRLTSYTTREVQNFIMLTPKLSLTYNNIMIDDYIEKGADAANLEIKTKDYQSLDINGGLALTFSRGISSNTSFQTILTGMVSYGIINDKVELDARYIDDDQFFRVYGFQPNDWTYSTGINFNLSFYDRIDLGLGFDYMFGDDVRGGMVKLSFIYNF